MNLDKTLIIALILVLVVVGPTQLPKLAKSFGRSAKALKDGMDGKFEVSAGESDAAKAESVKD